jgi:hypothetical protein
MTFLQPGKYSIHTLLQNPHKEAKELAHAIQQVTLTYENVAKYMMNNQLTMINITASNPRDPKIILEWIHLYGAIIHYYNKVAQIYATNIFQEKENNIKQTAEWQMKRTDTKIASLKELIHTQ